MENTSPVAHVSQCGHNNMHGLGVSHRDQSGPPAWAQRPLSTGIKGVDQCEGGDGSVGDGGGGRRRSECTPHLHNL